jgi:uncharacterized protein YacL
MHSYTSFVHYNFIWNGNFGFDKILRLFRQLILSIYYWIIFFIINYFYNWICNFIFPKSLWNFWQLYFFNFINIFGDNGIIILFFFIFFLFFLLSLLYFFSLLCLINIISSLVITIFFDDCFYKRYDKYLFNLDFIKNSNLFNKECETNIQKKKTIKKLKIPLFSKKFYLNLCLILLFIFFIFKIITGILCLN